MIYLTGDTHGRFERIGAFCDKMQTDKLRPDFTYLTCKIAKAQYNNG